MIVSGGVEEKVKTAVNHIRHAVIWVLFIIGVLYVMPKLLDIIGSPYAEILYPRNIYNAMSGLTDTIFGQPTSIWIWWADTTHSTIPNNFSDL